MSSSIFSRATATRLISIPPILACLLLAPPLRAAPEPPIDARPATSAAVEQPPLAPTPPTIEVEISPTIPDAQGLSDWIHRSCAEALSQLSTPPTIPGIIRVSISGELYDYEVSVTTIREGSTSEHTHSWPCECTHDDLLAQVRTEVKSAAAILGGSASPADLPPPPPPRAPTFAREGKIGLGMLGGGAALTIAGASLVATGERGSARTRAGIPTLALGLAAIGAGMALIIIDRRTAPSRTRPRVAAFPLVTPRGAHLGIAMRF